MGTESRGNLFTYIPLEWSMSHFPAASPEILHRTVWRTVHRLFRRKVTIQPILSRSFIHFSLKGWENVLFWTWEWKGWTTEWDSRKQIQGNTFQASPVTLIHHTEYIGIVNATLIKRRSHEWTKRRTLSTSYCELDNKLPVEGGGGGGRGGSG